MPVPIRRVKVVGPDGQKGTVPESNLAAAKAKGFREATYEEQVADQRAAEPGLAAEEAGLRGATLGLSDPLLVAGGIPAAEIAGRKKENPVAAGLGEAGGTVAGALLPVGPVAAVAKAGQAAKVAAGGKLVGALAGGAAEGTLFGLGQMISETSIGDPTTNAEKLAGLTGGALFGAGLNAVTHGAGAAGSALVSKFGGKTLNAALNDLADAGVRAQLGSKKVMNARSLYGTTGDEVIQYARKAGLVSGGDTNESFLAKVLQHKQDIGNEIGDVLTKASSRTVTGLDGQPATQTIAGGFDTLGLERRVNAELLDPLRRDPGSKPVVKRIEEYLNDLNNQSGGYTLADAHGLQSKLNKQIGFADVEGTKQVMRQFRSIFRDEIKDQASAISPHYGAQLEDASGRYMKTKALEDLAQEQVNRQKANGVFGLRDSILGSAAGGVGALSAGPAGMLLGAAGSLASKTARERGGFMLAATADKLANSATLQRIAAGLKTTIDNLGSQGLLGPYQLALENAGAHGAMNLLATHVQLAQSDPKYLPTLGLEHEEGSASNQYADKADRLHSIESTIKEHDAESESQIGRFLGQTPGKAPDRKPIKADLQDFSIRMGRINQVLKDPTVINTSGIAATAPQLAHATAIQAQTAAQFLLDKAPKNPGVQGLKAFAMPWQPPQSELERWYRYVRVIEKPNDVLHQLARSETITPEAAETMRTVYPKMLEDMKTKMMNRLTVYDKTLPYAKKRAMDSLFGAEFRGGNPQQLALLQNLHSASMSKKAPMSTDDGRQTHTQEDNIDSQGVRLENGRSKP